MSNIVEDVKDYSKMTVYERLADIQMELLKVEVKQKNGFHGEFMPLEQLNSIILPECVKRGLTYYFTCSDTHLILALFDIKTEKRLSPAPNIRLPELTKDMKVEGGNNTYMKRYLLMNTFLICAESFDPDDTKDGLPPENASSAKKESVKKQEPVETVNVDIPKVYVDAIDSLHKKGLEDKDINFNAIRKQIFKTGNFNKAEKDAIARYCKSKWRPSK